MKTIYRNGQRFIITDALYEATTKLNNSPQNNSGTSTNQGSFEGLGNVYNENEFEKYYKPTYMQIYNIMLERIKNSNAIKNIEQKNHPDTAYEAQYSVGKYYYADIIKNPNTKELIRNSIKDDMNKNGRDNSSIEYKIFKAMCNYIYSSITTKYEEIAPYISSKILNDDITSLQARYLLTQAKESIKKDVDKEIKSKDTSRMDKTPQTDLGKSLLIKISYYKDDDPRNLIDFKNESGNIRNSLEAFFNNDPIYSSIQEKFDSSRPSITVGQDIIQFSLNWKENQDEETLKKLYNSLISFGKRIVKKYPQIFNIDSSIKMKFSINGQDYEDISVWDEAQSKEFRQLPAMLTNNRYDINKPIQDFFANYKSAIENKTISKSNDDYNKLLDEIEVKLKDIQNTLSGQDITNDNWAFDLANAFVENGVSTSTSNEDTIKYINNILFKSGGTEQPNSNNAELFYKMKKILDEIEVNDFYAMDNTLGVDAISNDNINGLCDSLKAVFNMIPGKNTLKEDAFSKGELSGDDLSYLYLEYAFCTLLSNLYNNLIAQELKKLSHSEIKALKDKIAKDNKNNKSSETIRNNRNFKSFVSIIGHKPNIKEDAAEYKEQFNLIDEFGKEIKRIEHLVIKGMGDYGIFSAEVSIRKIKIGKYDKILKNEYIQNSKIKNAIAYSYLTEFYKDIKDVKDIKINGADEKLKKTVSYIVPKNDSKQITFEYISDSILKEMLIFTDVNMQDIVAAFNENDELLEDFKIGTIRYATEGEGDRVVTIPILSKSHNNSCIGLFRVRKIFAKTRHSGNKLFKHDFFKKVFNSMKSR